jgi:hypothetical protein
MSTTLATNVTGRTALSELSVRHGGMYVVSLTMAGYTEPHLISGTAEFVRGVIAGNDTIHFIKEF